MSLIGQNLRTFFKKIRNDGDDLPLTMMEITNERITRKKYTRDTMIVSQRVVNTTERIIAPNGINLPETTFPLSLRTLSVASSSVNDTITGTGAQTIIVGGLDETFNVVRETLSLNGQNPVNTVNQYFRINDLFVVNSGSSNKNEGFIYVSDDTDTFINGQPQNRYYFGMEIGDCVGKTGVYTVPAFSSWTPSLMEVDTDATSAKPVRLRFYKDNKKQGGNSFARRERYYISSGRTFDLSNAPDLDAGSDFYMTAQAIQGNIDIHISHYSIIKKR